MSTESQVMALLEEGNPATEAEDAARYAVSAAEHLAVLEERGSVMTRLTKDRMERTGRRRSVVWAAAAIVAVVLGSGVFLVSQRQSDVAQPPASTTVSPTTVSPTTTSQPSTLDTAQDLVDALYAADGQGLSALPWAIPSAMDDISWLSTYVAYTNSAVSDSACETVSIGVVCTVRSTDDISRLIDQTAVYEDTITLRFNVSTGQIVAAQWQSEWTGQLNDFLEWTGTNGDGIYDTGAVCHPVTDQPVACAQTLTQLAKQYVSTQGS